METSVVYVRIAAVVGFNGATLSRTWKHERRLADIREINRLQWGHAQPNVETARRDARPDAAIRASMGPRSAERGNGWLTENEDGGTIASMGPRSAERGNGWTLKSAPPSSNRFNGATLSRTWKREAMRRASQVNLASMGPRSAERGNSAASFAINRIFGPLQWGHAQPNVETRRRLLHRR